MLSFPVGIGSEPTKSVMRTPGIRRPCSEVSTAGLRMKVPTLPDPCVVPERTLEAPVAKPEIVEMPVAVVASSMLGGGLSITLDSLGPGLDVTR